MANFTISPGVTTNEIDNTFLLGQPVQAGAAIIGPTVKGPVNEPTLVTSYSDFTNKFGSTFMSGGREFSYFTSISAYNYFEQGGGSLLVTRVVSGTFSSATSSIIPTSIAATDASATVDMSSFHPSGSFSVNGITLFVTGSSTVPTNTSEIIYFTSGSTAANTAITASIVFNNSSSVAPYSSSLSSMSASFSSTNLIITYTGSNGLVGNTFTYVSGSTTYTFGGGTNTEAFVLETLSEGVIMNSTGSQNSIGMLSNGTADNLRWEIQSPNTQSGTFSLLINLIQ